MDDLISRQAVIEDIRTMIPKDAQLDIKWIEMWLMQLPSAQPEIIRCKDCAKREYCRTSTVWAVPPSDDWFCGDAELYKGEQE